MTNIKEGENFSPKGEKENITQLIKKKILVPSLKFAAGITAIGMLLYLIISPIMIGFAFDTPGTTWGDVFLGLLKFFLNVLIDWFVIALIFNTIKTYIKNRN